MDFIVSGLNGVGGILNNLTVTVLGRMRAL